MSQRKTIMYFISKSIDLCPSETKIFSQDKFKPVSHRGPNPYLNSKLFCHLNNLQNSHYCPKNNFTSEHQKNRRNGKSVSQIKSFRKINDNGMIIKKKKSIITPPDIITANKSNGFNIKELSNQSFSFLNKIQKKRSGQRYYQI